MKMFQNSKLRKKASYLLTSISTLCLLTLPAFAAQQSLSSDLDKVASPIVELLNALLAPALAIVVAAGSLYCVVLGVKFAKAEEPQEREKAKSHLKNAIIGFVLIFVLMMVLNVAKAPLLNWMNRAIAAGK